MLFNILSSGFMLFPLCIFIYSLSIVGIIPQLNYKVKLFIIPNTNISKIYSLFLA